MRYFQIEHNLFDDGNEFTDRIIIKCKQDFKGQFDALNDDDKPTFIGEAIGWDFQPKRGETITVTEIKLNELREILL